jgi:hypothetical protein
VKSRLMISMLVLACSVGVAQAQLAQPNPRATGRPGMRPPAPKPVNVPFEPMWKKDEQGKIIPLTGHYDLLALRNNPTVSDETLAKCEPAIREWLAEVDRVTIDNLDFVEKLQGGMLENFKLGEGNQIREVSEMMQQLMSAAGANRFLNEKGLLDTQQIGVSQQIINDYQQQRMNEIRPTSVNQQNLPKEEQEAMASEVSRLLYRMSANDVFVAYDRLIADAGKNLGSVLGGMNLSADVKSKAESAWAGVAQAGDAAGKAKATKATLAALSFDQRREAFEKLSSMRGPGDLWAGMPARPANLPANARPAPLAAPSESNPEKR